MMVQNEQGAWYENNRPPIGDCSLMLAAAKDAEIEQLQADRARLLEILREFSVALDLRKDELDEMIKRAKDGDYLPEDFHLGLFPPAATK